jgi:hypothetical protein
MGDTLLANIVVRLFGVAPLQRPRWSVGHGEVLYIPLFPLDRILQKCPVVIGAHEMPYVRVSLITEDMITCL